jgi:heat shock protein HslJ
MDQESAFLSGLSMTASFRVSESTLKFYDANGKTVLVFVPA